MNRLLIPILIFCFFSFGINAQVNQFPQVYNNYMDDPGASDLNIRSGPGINYSIIDGFDVQSRIGAVSLSDNSSDPYFYNWVKVCLPSTNGSISYGYIACDEFYARINPINNYATVTATSLYIRPEAGNTSNFVQYQGQNARYGQNSIVALTGATSTVSSVIWYEVFLTMGCSQDKGWLSGTYLSINQATTNYRIVGGRVCDDTYSCNYLGNINGANVNISGIGTIHSSGGFYQYKLSINYNCEITCSHPNYNSSDPLVYYYTASSHNYSKNFILFNTQCTTPTTQAHNITFPNVGTTTMTINWENGSGDHRIVKMNTSNSFTPPSNGTDPSSNTNYSGGQQVIYNGNGNPSVSITGLTANTTYYFRVYEANCTGSNSQYNTNTGTNNPASKTTNSSCIGVAITSQPQNQSAIVGGTATFEIVLSGTSPFTYQWRKNGVNIPSANSSTYTTPVLTLADNGNQYSCYVTNCSGNNNVTSNNATLTVTSSCTPVTISTQPQSQSKLVGETATFEIVLSGTSPFTYQWRKNGVNIPSANSSTNTTPVLTLADNGNQYSCYVTNCSGNNNVTSNNATLTVTSSCTPVTISTQPQSQSKLVGETATFSVGVNGTAPFLYFWYKNGVQLFGENSSSYTTPPLTIQDNNNTYYCIITNCISMNQAISNIATLSVTSSCTPVTSASLPATTYGTIGNSVQFTVTYNGSSPHTFQWYQDGALLTGQTNSSFSIPVLNSSYDGKKYKCKVTNSCNGTNTIYSNESTLSVSTSCTRPTSQAKDIVFSNITSSSVTLTWTKGNGEKRIVVCKANNPITATPIDNLSYAANSFFKSGSPFNQGYVVYNGSDNTVTISNLTNGTTYYFRIFEYSCSSPLYLTSEGESGNPASMTLGSSTIMSLIGINNIKNNISLPENYTFYSWNYNETKNPIKVCADGSTSTYFKVQVNNTDGIGFQIYDGNTKVCDTNFSVDEEKYGKLGTPYTFGGNYVEIAYTHPEYMNNPNLYYSNNLYLKITYYNQPISGMIFQLFIYRPPILFIHGLWGNDEAFEKMEYIFIDDNFQDSDLMYKMDYSKDKGASRHFYENDYKVAIARGNLFEKIRKKGFSAGKIDIVAHSMGGILARRYIQNQTGFLYINDVNKLITINTPHNGTQAANLLLNSDNKRVRDFMKTISVIPGQDLYSELGAVSDLRANSPSICSLNQGANIHNDVSIYTFNGAINFSEAGLLDGAKDKLLIEFAYDINSKKYCDLPVPKLCSEQELLDYIYDNDESDLIVPISSQKGGITFTNSIPIKEVHTESKDNYSLIQKMKVKLMENPNDGTKFSKNGFGKLESLKIKNTVKVLNDYIESLVRDFDSILIVSPSNNSNFNPGDSIDINVIGTPDIKKILLFCGNESFYKFYSSDTNFLNLNFIIPIASNGPIDITSIGLNNNGDISQQQINVNLIINAAIDSLQFSPNPLTVSPGFKSNFELFGTYSDGIKRKISEYSEMNIYLADTNVAKLTNINEVKGIQFGQTNLYVSYHNIIDSILLNVLDLGFKGRAAFNVPNNTICLGNTLEFENVSTGVADSVLWYFEGGTPHVSREQNQIVTYQTLGTFDAAIYAYYQGRIDTFYLEDYITVNPHPKVNVAWTDSTTICKGDTMLLIADGCNYYQWNNGVQSCCLQVSQPGDYFVTAYDEKGCSDVSDTITIKVKEPQLPIISISSTDTLICKGQSIEINADIAYGGYSPEYKWYINDIESGQNSNSLTLNNLQDDTKVSCQLKSNEFCISDNIVNSNILNFQVLNELIPQIDIIVSDTSVCENEVVTINSQIVNGGQNPQYSWFVNDVFSGQTGPGLTLNNLNQNTEVYCVLISNAECLKKPTDTSEIIKINVSQKLTPDINISANKTKICEGDLVILKAEIKFGGNDPKFKWFINDELLPFNSPDVTLSDLSDGDNIRCILISDAECTVNSSDTSNTITINQNEIMTPSIEIITEKTSICEGENISFNTIVANEGSSPIYEWYLNGELQSEKNAVFSGNDFHNGDSIYCVLNSDLLCVTDPKVKSNILIMEVKTLVIPSVHISVIPSPPVIFDCEVLKFISNPIFGGNNPVFFWYVNDIESGQGEEFISSNILNGSMIYCKMLSSESCLTYNNVISNRIGVSVNQLPQPVIGVINDTIFSLNYDDPKFSYTWFLNGEIISNESSIRCSNFGSGKYYLVIGLEDCMVTSNIVDISCSVSTDEFNNENYFIVFPNPTSGKIQIEGRSSEPGKFNFKVYNLLGIKLAETSSNCIDNKVYSQFDLHHESAGLYFIFIEGNNYRKVIMVEKVD